MEKKELAHPKHKGGAPRQIDPKKLAKEIDKFVEEHDLPFIATICTELKIGKTRLYELIAEDQELANSIDRAKDKCESNVLINGLKGGYNGSMSQFVLRNFGWSDKPVEETDNTVKVEIVNVDEYTN